MRPSHLPWLPLRSYATGGPSRLGPTLSLEHVCCLPSYRSLRRADPIGICSFSSVIASCRSTAPSSEAHAGLKTRPPAPRRGGSPVRSSRDTAESQILFVPLANPPHPMRFERIERCVEKQAIDTDVRIRATSGTFCRQARQSGKQWRGILRVDNNMTRVFRSNCPASSSSMSFRPSIHAVNLDSAE